MLVLLTIWFLQGVLTAETNSMESCIVIIETELAMNENAVYAECRERRKPGSA